MKPTRQKCVYSLLLTLCMTCSLLAGCSSGTGTAVSNTAASQSSTPESHWTISGLERVGKSSSVPVNASTDAELCALKGETTDFQVVVKAAGDAETVITSLTISDLTGTNGTISASQAALYREHFVAVPAAHHSWASDGADNLPDSGDICYPDVLIPFVQNTASAEYIAVPYRVEPGENAVFWVDLAVPSDAKAGTYTGKYTITTDNGDLAGTIQLTVWNAALPKVPSLTTSVSIQAEDASLSVMETLLQHGMSISNALAPQQYAALDGQQYAETGFWGNMSYGDTSMAAPPAQEVIAARAAELRAALGSDMMLVNYTVDEIEDAYDVPEYHDAIRQSLYQWHQVLSAAGVKLLAVCKPYADLLDDSDLGGTGEPLVDIFVTLDTLYETPYAAYEPGDSCAEIAALAQEKGCQIWTYTALVQDGSTPTWLLDYEPINYRISQGFVNQAIGATGTLYWAADQWSDDPWATPWTEEYAEFPGEGLLVYPGVQAGVEGVVPSIRLKWIRDGIYDYDYIELAKEAGMADEAMEIVTCIASGFTDWTKDAEALLAARVALGSLLDS